MFAIARRIFPATERNISTVSDAEPAALVAIGQKLARAWTRRKQNAESRGRCFTSTPRIDALSARMPARTGRSQPGIAVSDRAKLGGLTQFLPRRGLSSFQIAEYRGDRVRHYEERSRRVRQFSEVHSQIVDSKDGEMSEWSSAFAALPLRRDISPWLATQSARAVAAQWFISETVLIAGR